MATFKNLTESTDFQAQMQLDDKSPIVLFNIFEVPADKDEAFLAYWGEDAAIMKAQPGFLSGQLHKATAGSRAYVNIAHWESVGALSTAFHSERFQEAILECPTGVTASPIVMKKIAIPGICTA